MNVFGYEIKKKDKQGPEKVTAFADKQTLDGTLELEQSSLISAVSNNQYIFDFEQEIQNEKKLVQEYRRIAKLPDVDSAIDDIVNEAIVVEDDEDVVSLDLGDTAFSASIQKKVAAEFEELSTILSLNKKASDIFKQWYIDGKMYYHKAVNSDKQSEGIKELIWLDPTKIKKVREAIKEKNPVTGMELVVGYEEYYLFDPNKDRKSSSQVGYASQNKPVLKILPEAVAYVPSGNIDMEKNRVLSYLDKALVSANQLALLESSLVIYRLARAPERRVFYIDVGNLPKTKAEQYMRDIITKFKNKSVYDANTGQVANSKAHLSMLEDVWLPRREGSRGTEVDTLPGGQNLGDIEDVLYFRKKLFKSMNLPVSRLEAETAVNLGRSSEITRDELKFSKFVQKLVNKFSEFLYDILKTQLVLKGIMSKEDWDDESENVKFRFNKDSYFTELKNMEILQERFAILADADDYAGKYISIEFIQKNILQLTDDEIKQIEQENKENPPEDEDDGFGSSEPEPEEEPEEEEEDDDKEEEDDDK